MSEAKAGDPRIDFKFLRKVLLLTQEIDSIDVKRNLDYGSGDLLKDLGHAAVRVGDKLKAQKRSQSETSRKSLPSPILINDDLKGYLERNDFRGYMKERKRVHDRDKK